MNEFSLMTDAELREVCEKELCCTAMSENTFNGDVDFRHNMVCLPCESPYYYAIKFCPWCGKKILTNTRGTDLISYMYKKRVGELEKSDED